VKGLDDTKYWQRALNMKGTTYAHLNRGKVRIAITLTDEMLEALKARAIAERRSVAGMVRHLCLAGLQPNPVTPGYRDPHDQSQVG
jgi:hypothetical protein